MSKMLKNDLLQRALKGEKTSRPPVWLMRQAGRTDPEYNQLKIELNMTLEDMFASPEVSTKVSLLPRKLGVDAIIFFQDILTILGPMGAEFKFRPGPTLESPIRSSSQIKALKHFDVEKEMDFVPKTLKMVQNELDGSLPVLGFAGAPFTLAVFLVQGKSFGGGVEETMDMIKNNPDMMKELVAKLTPITTEYLQMQAEAGVAGVQLFESAAHLLTADQYREFALPAQQEIFSALKGKVPTITFAHNFEDLSCLKDAGADVVSLPSSISIKEARKTLGPKQVIQGNVSNKLLETGSHAEIRSAVKECLLSGESTGHIFNLDHGLLRTTPFENVQEIVKAVKEISSEIF